MAEPLPAQPGITGVILAGGQGSRMDGQDKGLLPFQGLPLIEHVIAGLQPQVASLLISANRNTETYGKYGYAVVSDSLADSQGPLAGFLAALQSTTADYILTVPCDAPTVPPALAERLLTALRQEKAELAVAHDGQHLQPMYALLPTSLLGSLENFLAEGGRGPRSWYAQQRMTTADFSDCTEAFNNMNTPEEKHLMELRTPLLGFCAYSGTGKTTLLTRLIPLLANAGLRIAVVKHTHHVIDLDKPGKDSYRLREAGAAQVVLASHQRIIAQRETADGRKEASLADAIQSIPPDSADLILVEGFKHASYPKIELHRPSFGKAAMYPDDSNIIAVATDDAGLELPSNLGRLDLNQPEQIATFILNRIQKAPPPNRITSAPSCADDHDPSSLSVEEARSRIMDTLQPTGPVLKRSLREALGQVLAEDVISPINVPNHTNSAMDGYALGGDDLPGDEVREYRIIGTAYAGVPFTAACGKGECVRIMTGAPIPAGTDTVVMQEQTEAGAEGYIRIGAGHRAGQNVRQAGEDIAKDSVVLSAGRRVNPADLGVLASLGVSEISVQRPLRVAFFSTGDELRSIGEPLRDGEVYDSNRYALYGMLQQLNVEILDMGVVRDDPVLMEATFQQASAVADVVITSGGVSVGEADYTKIILDKLGQINFWKIAIKPGRPLAFGKLGNALFFGLPGNPVAVMVTFLQFVQPALLKLAGQQDYEPLLVDAICQSRLKKKPGRAEFQRGTVTRTADGKLVVEKSGYQGSGVLTSMSKGNCLIIIPQESATVEPGDVVQVQPFGW